MDNLDKFSKKSLPEQYNFYSQLDIEDITDVACTQREPAKIFKVIYLC